MKSRLAKILTISSKDFLKEVDNFEAQLRHEKKQALKSLEQWREREIAKLPTSLEDTSSKADQ